jgi:iron-sulfur cluster assembly accessory protein
MGSGLDFRACSSNMRGMTQAEIQTGIQAPFTVTPRAAKRIQAITANVPGAALRVAVNGGGCSGFQYEFAIAKDRAEDDAIFEQDGATVLVDSISMGFVAGSVLDFEDNLIGQSFKVQNPQAKSSCGCGTSFSI